MEITSKVICGVNAKHNEVGEDYEEIPDHHFFSML